MRFLPDFMSKGRQSGRASGAPRQPEVIHLHNGSSVAILQWNESIAAEAAMSHVVIRRAVDKIASSVQQVGWKAEIDTTACAADQRGKESIVTDLNTFLNNPHDEMTPEMLRYWMALNFTLFSRIPFKVGFQATKPLIPNGIWPLETKHVHAVYNDRGIVTGYQYGTGHGKATYRSQALATKPGQDFIAQIWKPGITGRQDRADINTAMNSIGLPAQVIKSLLVRAINTAEGHPNVRYLVTADTKITVQQADALRHHLNEEHGVDGVDAGKIPILSRVPGLKIHTLDNDLSDIHSKMPMDDMQRLIFGAFGIPLSQAGIGAADASKFAGNFDSGRVSFWEDTIDPMYVSPIFGGLTQALCPPGVCIKPDYDKVPAMQLRRVQKMTQVNTIEFLTTTEKREMFGLPENKALPEATGGRPQQTGAKPDADA